MLAPRAAGELKRGTVVSDRQTDGRREFIYKIGKIVTTFGNFFKFFFLTIFFIKETENL